MLRRAAALAAALEDQRCVAVAGTHGKTSTTSLLVVAAQACGVDPSFAIGGNLYETGKNAHLGTGDARRRRGRRERRLVPARPGRRPRSITNVEADHLENHGDLEGIFRAFEQFVDRVDPDGLLLTCADDAGARRIADYARGHRPRACAPTARSADADVRRQRRRRPRADAVEFAVDGLGPAARAASGSAR